MRKMAGWVIGITLALTASVARGQATNTFPASGNVGIGTTTPATTLQVIGSTAIGQNTNGTAIIDAYSGDAYYGNNAATNGIAINPAGFVGIGTATPVAPLHVAAGDDTTTGQSNCGAESSSCPASTASGYGLVLDSDYSTGQFRWRWEPIDRSGNISLYIQQTTSTANSYSNVARFGANQYDANAFAVFGSTYLGGSVGIGTTSPGATLEVNGNVKLTSGSGASITFADGTVQSTAYTGVTCGGDFAESVDVAGRRASYEPGDVLVIDPNAPGKFLKSSKPYSTSVLGIYSTKPGVVGRRQTTPKKPDEVPMAMVGIVPTRVSAENGPIRPGDLLVTASRPGYAMKGTDRSRMLGAVIGKALGSLDRGTGVIEVGVTLQ